MKTKITLIVATALLVGCSSVSEKIPTVKIEKRKSAAAVQSASYQSASYVTPGSTDQAAVTCETDDMRRKVLDGIDGNDTVRIKIVEDSDTGSRILSQVEVDCQDYFLRKTVSPAQPTIIRASVPTTQHIETVQPAKTNNVQRFTYIVQKGDTVWDIARQHCTTAEAISRLNGLGRGNVIDIGQRLKLPDEEC